MLPWNLAASKGGGYLSRAMRDEGWNHTQWSPKWMKLGLLDQFFVLKKMKTVSDTTDSFWGQKWPIFAPKTAFLADFEIIGGISIFFHYLKWIILCVHHQLLKLIEIKTVSDTFNSFWGQKWPMFAPKNCSIGWFWENWRRFYTYLISKMD